MREDLFNLVHPDKLDELYFNKLDFKLRTETVSLSQAKGRIIAKDITSQIDLPPFTRSSMDGYAVKAADTFSASEQNSSYLELIGKVEMGKETDLKIDSGQAVEINTGGMIPQGADGVLMIEYTEKLSETMIELNKSVAPGENIISRGEDIAQNELLIKQGTKLRAQEIAALAGLGITEVEVFARPKISLYSTGDELVDADSKPKAGEIRDINSYSTAALADGLVDIVQTGIINDNPGELEEAIKAGLAKSQVVILSGGSSVGTKDLTIEVLNRLGEPGVLVHGVAIKPGKPTILAIVDGKAVIGLPGHPTSAMVVFEIVVKPLLRSLNGYQEDFIKLSATLSRNVASDKGRREYIRVALTKDETGANIAEPITGKSGLIKTMLKADGLVKSDIGSEGIAKDSQVEVLILN